MNDNEESKTAWQHVQDAAQALKDAVDRAAHTSPADVAEATKQGVNAVVNKTHESCDALVDWVRNHTGHPGPG